jgi:hypothetical protein
MTNIVIRVPRGCTNYKGNSVEISNNYVT